MLEKMKEMLAEQLNCEASTITPETSFKDDLGADSLICLNWSWLLRMSTMLRSRQRSLQI